MRSTKPPRTTAARRSSVRRPRGRLRIRTHDKTTNCRHDVIIELYGTSESGPGQASTLYKVPLYYTTPRYVQFGVSYDF